MSLPLMLLARYQPRPAPQTIITNWRETVLPKPAKEMPPVTRGQAQKRLEPKSTKQLEDVPVNT